jgi:hypothetical protein
MRNPIEVGPDHVENWIDRMGNIEFISDHTQYGMNDCYYRSAIQDHDRNYGLTEAAVWWM